jgi:hypothetical protein
LKCHLFFKYYVVDLFILPPALIRQTYCDISPKRANKKQPNVGGSAVNDLIDTRLRFRPVALRLRFSPDLPLANKVVNLLNESIIILSIPSLCVN